MAYQLSRELSYKNDAILATGAVPSYASAKQSNDDVSIDQNDALGVSAQEIEDMAAEEKMKDFKRNNAPTYIETLLIVAGMLLVFFIALRQNWIEI